MRRGELDSARAVCRNEGDKIEAYPDIKEILKNELFEGVDEKDIPMGFYKDPNYWKRRLQPADAESSDEE